MRKKKKKIISCLSLQIRLDHLIFLPDGDVVEKTIK